MNPVAKKIDTKDQSLAVRWEVNDEGIGTITFDLPGEKINKLSRAVFERLYEILQIAAKEKNLRGVMLKSGKPDIFIAGADITEIAAVTDPKEAEEMSQKAQAVFQALEDLRVPTLAVIHGPCLGGGMETVLACDYRIASDDPKTKLGQPEVNLGIIPGAGGTQRLPRLCGLPHALDLILTGRLLDARKSKKIGLVDRTALRHDLDRAAESFMRELAEKKKKRKKPSLVGDVLGVLKKPGNLPQGALGLFLEDTPLGRQVVFKKARAGVMKKTKGFYPAPLRAIEAIEASASSSEAKGYAVEAKIFGELAVTPTCKNLIRIFFANEAVKKDPGVEHAKPREVSQIGVLGAGIMGGGIAQIFAHNGIRVRMKDINHEALARGLRAASDVFQERIDKKRMKPRERDQKMALISTTTAYTGFSHLDLVVEAVVEDLGLKQKVIGELEEVIAPHAIVATNTSSLSITAIASKLKNPTRVVGMHFFNPVHRMPLIEVIPGKETNAEAIATVVALSKKLGKVPVVVGDGPGFLVNRILGIYLNEAAHLYAEGADIEAIDRAMLDFGMPMGPFRLLDEVGLKTAVHVGKILHDGLGERLKPLDLLETVVHDGRLGKAAGKGFYVYSQDGEEDSGKDVDHSVDDLWPSRKEKNFDGKEIHERLLLSMINEASRCLTEKIARSSRDLDIAMVMGTGFPPFHGGLASYANSLGLATVVERLTHYQKKCGERFTPHEELARLAKDGKTL